MTHSTTDQMNQICAIPSMSHKRNVFEALALGEHTLYSCIQPSVNCVKVNSDCV